MGPQNRPEPSSGVVKLATFLLARKPERCASISMTIPRLVRRISALGAIFAQHRMKALVFDLGGVILPLNRPRAEAAFQDLARAAAARNLPFAQAYAALLDDGFFDQFEKGQHSGQQFLNVLVRESGADESEVREVWHSILEPLPPENLRTLAQLAQKYPLYLLSNTNVLHMDWIFAHLERDHGLSRFGGLFEQLFLSYELGTRKPEPGIYRQVALQTGLPPGDLLFVDDHPDNVDAALAAGWQALLHPANALLESTANRWL
jgi:putative hydrolase of the HAD superfamily